MEYFVGQIVWFAFDYLPTGTPGGKSPFVPCNGQTLEISQYQALFAAISNTYGGDGTTNFNVPSLQGRVAIGLNNVQNYIPNNPAHPSYALGNAGGEEFHALALGEIPSHSHTLNADTSMGGSSNGGSPAGSWLGASADADGNPVNSYAAQSANTTLASPAVGNTGAGAGHENRMPYVVLQACICATGIFPTRN